MGQAPSAPKERPPLPPQNDRKGVQGEAKTSRVAKGKRKKGMNDVANEQSRDRRKKRRRKASKKRNPDATLEAMPPGIRLEIMALLHLDDLQQLVQASPNYLQLYRQHRPYILRHSFVSSLEHVLLEAVTVLFTKRLVPFSTASDTHTFKTIVNQFHSMRGREPYAKSQLIENMEAHEIEAMAKFYYSVIQPLTEFLPRQALPRLVARDFDRENFPASLCQTRAMFSWPENEPPPTVTEKFRFMRALYRYQILCNVYGIGAARMGIYGPAYLCHLMDWSKPEGLLPLYLDHFNPWEIEEMNCVHVLATEKVNQIFYQLKLIYDRQQPLILDHPDVAQILFLGDPVTIGLPQLIRIMSKEKDYENLMSFIYERVSECHQGCQVDRRKNINEQSQEMSVPSLKTHSTTPCHAETPKAFLGDHEPDEQGNMEPPLAWILMCNNFSGSLDRSRLDDRMRGWGYVMWDAYRLKRHGGDSIVVQQFHEFGCGEDDRRKRF
ncbi:hypothetical protein S40288_10915 [Stachybotrys chartarum IBT 40288]|nr:hypothetical protein S40288_10915 [Stachybotrys chartarum IBT 40288]